jgi:ADP-heptose:LPS heptosyltransferase
MVKNRRPHTLVVRMDSMGDVLLAGPAVRAIADGSRRVSFLAGPLGADAARLLPGVDEVLEWSCPWILAHPDPVRRRDVARLVSRVRRLSVDKALILTSFHQSALPMALLLRMAGVPWIGAVSEDYPGALLDLRHPDPGDVHEVNRALSLASTAGFGLPPDDDGRLAVQVDEHLARSVPAVDVVLHPGTSVPARAWPPASWATTCRLLTNSGLRIAVTGSALERPLTASVADGTNALDLGGRTSLAQLAAVLHRARVVVVANTGAAHLAAATHTPVVSLFAPTVPAVRWAPYGTTVALLGDQEAACRGTRATICPIPGHPCLTTVSPKDVVEAVVRLHPSHPETPAQLEQLGGLR